MWHEVESYYEIFKMTVVESKLFIILFYEKLNYANICIVFSVSCYFCAT